MTDIEVLSNTELMVAGITGVSDEGVGFVDAYTVDPIFVVDSGRIIVAERSVEELVADALTTGLKVVIEKQP